MNFTCRKHVRASFNRIGMSVTIERQVIDVGLGSNNFEQEQTLEAEFSFRLRVTLSRCVLRSSPCV